MEVGKLWVELDLDLKGFNTKIEEAKQKSGVFQEISKNFNGLKTLEGDFKNLVKPISDTQTLVSGLIGGFKSDFATLTKPIKDVNGTFNSFMKGMSGDEKATGLAGKLGKAFGNIKKNANIGDGFTKGLKNIHDGLEVTGGKMSSFVFGPYKTLLSEGKKFKGVVGDIKVGDFSKITKPFNGLKENFSGLGKSIKATPKSILSAFGTVEEGIGGLKNNVVTTGPKILTGFKNAFKLENIMKGASNALKLLTGPWGALIFVVMAGVGAIIANWGSIQKWVQQHFGGTLPKNFTQFKQMFIQIWGAIEKAFTVVWNNIKAVVTQVWNYIGPTIMGAVNKISAYWKQIWPELKQLFVEAWTFMKIILAPIIAFLYMIITTQVTVIKAVWKDAWNIIKDAFKTVWDTMVGVLRIAWDIISGVFKVALDLLTGNWKQAWTDIKKIFSSVWDDIGKLFSSIAQNALKWGSDIIQGIIDGITGAIKGIEKAVSGVADKIKSFLHFSRPDEGPLRDYEEWMPDFMNGLGKGIDDNKSKLINSVKGLASNMALNVNGALGSNSGISNKKESIINMYGPVYMRDPRETQLTLQQLQFQTQY